MSAHEQAFSGMKSAITVKLAPGTLYVAGAPIRGELQFSPDLLHEDDLESVSVELQGTILTKCRVTIDVERFEVKKREFLKATVTPWTSVGSDSKVLDSDFQVPFELELPPDAPPSFGYENYMSNAHVRYALQVTAMRAGAIATDKTITLPIVVVRPDPAGSSVRQQLASGWDGSWGRLLAESKVRKYPWGKYGSAKMELLLPHIGTCPLFTDIPYTIIVTTVSATVKGNGQGQPEETLFPSLPSTTSEIDFELRRTIEMETPFMPSNPEERVIDIIPKADSQTPPVDMEIGEYTWIPDEKADQGRWMRQATYHSSMNLRVTPTFLTDEIKVKYSLLLRLEFPGMGKVNVLRIAHPINVSSGIESSVSSDAQRSSSIMIDLPASYWEPSSWTEV